jgi:V-type H+-transporting ATPase subunit C
MSTPYWIVSLPLDGSSADECWATLQRHTGGSSDLSVNYRLTCPDLRVGTLDSLLALSDDLVKVNSASEQVVEKVRRQFLELETQSGREHGVDQPTTTDARNTDGGLTIDGESVERFLTTFEWDEAKHPARRALKETVEKLSERVARIEEEFKLKCGQMTMTKNQLNSLLRKQGTGVNARDLGDIINADDLIQTENLTTLIVSVPKLRVNEWNESYETLSQFVVPRSSKVVHTDGDSVLHTVVLFRRVVDAFITAAREKVGSTAKEYSHDPEAFQEAKTQRAEVERELAERRESLVEWCQISYGEAFSLWMHVCMVRIFVESILRYGLPPDFQAVLMRPNLKQSTKLRKVLNQEFGKDASSHWDDSGAEEKTAGAGLEDLYSYVSLTIKV